VKTWRKRRFAIPSLRNGLNRELTSHKPLARPIAIILESPEKRHFAISSSGSRHDRESSFLQRLVRPPDRHAGQCFFSGSTAYSRFAWLRTGHIANSPFHEDRAVMPRSGCTAGSTACSRFDTAGKTIIANRRFGQGDPSHGRSVLEAPAMVTLCRELPASMSLLHFHGDHFRIAAVDGLVASLCISAQLVTIGLAFREAAVGNGFYPGGFGNGQAVFALPRKADI